MSDKDLKFNIANYWRSLWKFLRELQRISFQASVTALINSVPLIGPQLANDRRILARLHLLVEGEDDIQNDIEKATFYMSELETTTSRLIVRLEDRKKDLKKTLEDYKRYKGLAVIERDKAEPLLSEFRREGNKGVLLGIIVNAIFFVLGILVSYYL